jgi:hypothetical protein
MTFRVGQKVVCVDASVGKNIAIKLLVVGHVYTIKRISHGYSDGGYGLHMAELPELYSALGQTIGWAFDRFRPIVERKTDISIFTAMLNPTKQGVNA